jgi:23S rRNA (uracil1939-C5)-methyltransferase
LNHLEDRVRFVRARVEDALTSVRRSRVDLAVLDPPRQGCPPSVITRLFGDLAPARVVYVSCNAEALAKELPAIVESGYDVRRVQPIDMFPHTTHVETVTLHQGRRIRSA